MENQKINELLAELNENLKLNCCAKEITPQLIIDPKKSLFVKLYDTICDACNETENFALYPLHSIIHLNNKTNRPSGIICRDCKEQGCKTEGCVISLRINSRGNTRFSKINKLEIIAI
jgi:hypothetical protein